MFVTANENVFLSLGITNVKADINLHQRFLLGFRKGATNFAM